jgi:cold-inducible RNA-binding protein
MQIYVGNLPSEFTDDQLKALFEPYGKVSSATIGRNKKTEESEGYGIVEMPVKSEARTAVEEVRGKEIEGKLLRARILKPDDPMHGAMAAKTGGPKGSVQFRGDVPYRGSGAIRRGGQRGS